MTKTYVPHLALVHYRIEHILSQFNGEISGAPSFASYEYEGGARNGAHSGSTALYQHNGSRYGLALGNGRFMSQENNKMGGLHGTKHKRGDIDRECAFQFSFKPHYYADHREPQSTVSRERA